METEVKSFKDFLQQAPSGPIPFSSTLGQEEEEQPTIPMKSFKAEVTTEMNFGVALEKYKGTPLTKEVILADKDLMGMVRDNIQTRFKDRNLLQGAATAVAGGATVGYGWENMDDEALFETWQNYHRSFAGGQTVTTANELAYGMSADEATKAKLGLGYTLFDSMDNAFVGEGTWSETFDATRDYATAAIWDPSTVISLGVGKAFAAAGGKGAAIALREGAKAAFRGTLAAETKKGVATAVATQTARQVGETLMRQGFKTLGTGVARQKAEDVAFNQVVKANVKLGMTEQAAQAVATQVMSTVGIKGSLQLAKEEALRFGIAAAAVDGVVAVGTDVAFQITKLTTGAQDEYSIPQTAVAALGAIVAPGLYAAAKAAARGIGKLGGFSSYKALRQDFMGKDPVAMLQSMKDKVDLTQVNTNLRSGMQGFLDNLENGLSWPDAKIAGKQTLANIGTVPTVNPSINDFMRRFIVGYVDNTGTTHNGYAQELARAGFQYVQRDKDDNITNFFGDAVQWIDPKIIARAVRGYEKAAKINLGIGYTPKTVSAAFKTAASEAGTNLRTSSLIANLLKKRDDPNAIASILKSDREQASYGAWMLSVWKRMVTSHPATTGANIKGYGGVALMNTTSDLVQGALEFGVGTYRGITGDLAGATEMIRKGKGSLLSAARRGYNVLDWDATLKEAEEFLSFNADAREQLFRQGTGEAGSPQATLKDFKIPDKGIPRGVEKVVGTAQQVTGVVLQDEITKKLSFMGALERQIYRTYGETYETFMSRADKWVEMGTEKFQTEVIARAIDRTARETASKTWGDKKGNTISLQLAKAIEGISNDQLGGYAVPFGRFFNTATATLGDFSMLNAIRHHHKLSRGKLVDASQDEGMELFAKGVAGISTVLATVPYAVEKIENGLAWNQERREDGSVADLTYDFPESFWRMAAQVAAHAWKDRAIPADLMENMLVTYGAGTFRASLDGIQEAKSFLTELASGDLPAAGTTLFDIIGNFMGGIASGMTRPLDPINTAVMTVTGDFAQPDRRQGNVIYNEATRYIDRIFGLDPEEQRNSPLRGPLEKNDLGVMLGGTRSNPENLPAERVMNSIGMSSWKAVKVDGPPELKNRVDGILFPIINTYAEIMLSKHPDFFDLPLDERQNLFATQVQGPAKKKALEELKTGGEDDQLLELTRAISEQGKGKVNKVLNELGYPSLQDILAEEGAREKLETMLYYLKHYEELKFGD